MKLASKLFSLVLALALVAICMIPAFAADAEKPVPVVVVDPEPVTELVELNPYVDANDQADQAVQDAADAAKKAADAKAEEEALSDALPQVAEDALEAQIKAQAAQDALDFTAEQYEKAQKAAKEEAFKAEEARRAAIYMQAYAEELCKYLPADMTADEASRAKAEIVDKAKAAAEALNLMTEEDYAAYDIQWDGDKVTVEKVEKADKADKADKAECKTSAKHVNTGDSAVLAAAAGVVLLAGVAFVVSKKRK